jgi:quinoprotein relay system zinc metallohydrolase 1
MKVWLSLLVALWPCLLQAAPFPYELTPELVAPNTYVITGKNEEFTPENGGHEVNVGFIVTAAGVVVVDTGPSKQFGEALVRAIRSVTAQPIVRVFLTNHLPDRFLGMQAFPEETLAALPQTKALIQQVGPSLLDNMYRLVGDAMRGTELRLPAHNAEAGTLTFGEHRLRLLALAGHTPADLLIFDETTGVLFTGGVVFHGRTPTTPFANLTLWLEELHTVEALNFQVLVPSHGAVAQDTTPIQHTRHYLRWLDATFTQSAKRGLHMNEVMRLPKPPQLLQRWALLREEFPRTVVHLYPKYEMSSFRLVGTPE